MTTMTDHVVYCPRICFRLCAILIHLVLFKKACEIKEILFNGLKLKKLVSGARCLFLMPKPPGFYRNLSKPRRFW